MDLYLQALWLRIRDCAQTCLAAAFPSDRPSGVFAVYTCLLNGSLLVWSFSEVLGNTCSRDTTIWISFGMAHCFVNMIFGVVSMMHIRRRIACGIPADTSQWHVFCCSPLMILYAFYLLFELIWMIAAGSYEARLNRRGCARHINVQIVFFVFYWLCGLLLLFQITFATERWRRPRWRNFAAMRWDYLHSTQRGRSVRWHDEHDSSDGGDEPVDFNRTEPRSREDTERTSTRDYASLRDDVTVETEDARERVVVCGARSKK